MSNTQLRSLAEQFVIPGMVAFTRSGELDLIEITSGWGTARILLQGALLLDWIPAGQPPVVWVSPQARYLAGKAPRGGVPVCWPWFGPHEAGAAHPAHGIARAASWDLIEVTPRPDGSLILRFQLHRVASDWSHWPFETPLHICYTVGETVEVELVTHNAETRPVSISEALHTYFGVSDISQVCVAGLEGCDYVDKVDQGERKTQAGPVTFSSETDRVYLDTVSDCVIEDPGYRRRIRIAKTGSQSTIIWNPWAEKAASMGDYAEGGYRHMVCVESGNALDNCVTLAAGDEHRLWVRYSVEPYA